jgi:hypothetical protein
MILYRTTDRIPVTLGDVKIFISPLTHEQKSNLNNTTKIVGGKETIDGMKMAFLALKYAVKAVEGITDADGNDYALDFEANGSLTDECANDLISLDHAEDLAVICVKLIDGVAAAKRIAEEKGLTAKIDFKGVKGAKKKLGAVS